MSALALKATSNWYAQSGVAGVMKKSVNFYWRVFIEVHSFICDPLLVKVKREFFLLLCIIKVIWFKPFTFVLYMK